MKIRDFQSDFVKSSFTLIGGVFTAQLINVLISPILTRLYEPSAFGFFAIYTALSMIMGAIATGKYEIALLLPKRDSVAINLFAFANFLALLLGLVIASIIFTYNIFAGLFSGLALIVGYLYILPIEIFATSLHETLNYWCTRKKQYALVSKYRIYQALCTAIISIGCAWIFKFEYGLVFGSIIGVLIATSAMSIVTFKENRKLTRSIRKKSMLLLAKTYYKFPKFYSLSSLLEKISSQLPVILLAFLYDPATLGIFAIAQRVTQLPTKLISRSVADVFLQQINQIRQNPDKSRKIYLKTLVALFAIGFIPFCLFLGLAPTLFEWVFGYNWRTAGEYSQIMAAMYFLEIITTPLAGILIIRQKQKTSMYLHILLVFISGAGLVIGKTIFSSAYISILLFSSIYCLKYLIELFLSYRYLGTCMTHLENNVQRVGSSERSEG